MSTRLDPKELRSLIESTLKDFPGLHSDAAVELLLGTCAQESSLGKYRHQLGAGPAHGIMQIEPGTFKWLNEKYRSKYPEIGCWNFTDLIKNDRASIVMARLRYLTVEEALPKAGDIQGQAGYYKKYYNTYHGKATVEEYMNNYRTLVEEA